MINSFAYELQRRGKGDIPGLCKRGSRTCWLEESSIFPHTDAALCWNSAALQLHFLQRFSSGGSSQAPWSWPRQNQVAALIHRLACSKYQLPVSKYQCFHGCPPPGKYDIWEVSLTSLEGSKNKARHNYLSQCAAVTLPRALLTFTSAPNPKVRNWSKP